jgi:hypothetical protein
MDLLAGLVIFVLFQLLLARHFAAYPFQLFSTGQITPPPDSSEIASYWIVAALLLALLMFGFGVAMSQSRTPAMITYPIVGVIAVICVLLFAVPTIDWNPDPVYPVNPNYCSRTDSENCPGG